MKVLVLTYFDVKAGPRIFLTAPESINKDTLKNIPKLLHIHDEGFFVHIFKGAKSYNYDFEISSQYARGNKEILLISLLTNVESKLNVNFAEELLKNFILELNNIEDAYKGFYYNRQGIISNVQKYNELKQLFLTYYKSFRPTIKALKEAEIRYQKLFESATDAIVIVDENSGIIIDVNKRSESLFNLSKKKIIGGNFKEFLNLKENEVIDYRSTNNLKVESEKRFIQWIRESNQGDLCVEITESDFQVGVQNLKQYFIRDITKRKMAEKKLKESEEKYRTFIEESFEGFMVIDSNAITLFLNQQMANILGYEINDIIGKKLIDFIDKDERNEINFVIEKRKKGVREELERTFIHKDGSKIYTKLRASPVFDENKKLKWAIAFISDITEQKLAENQIIESENKYRDLFIKSPESIVLTTPDGIMLECNPATERIFGFKKEEIIGKNYLSLGIYTSRQVRKFTKRFLAMKKGQEVEPIEMQIRKKDGSFAWIYYKSSLIRINETLLIETLIQDITEKKEAEILLKESEERYRLISEQSLMAIMIYQEGHITYANQAVSEINEYSIEEMKKMSQYHSYKLIHPDDMKHLAEKMKIRIPGAKEHIGETIFRVITKSKKIKWVQSFFRIFDIKGKLSILLTMIDISRKIKIERELKESEEKYRDAYNQVNLYKNLFAHDIGNILQSIYFSIELFERSDKFHMEVYDFKDMVKNCKKKIQRGKSLIFNVYQLSQVESTEKPLQKINAFNFLESSINLLSGSNYDKKINITLDSSISFPEEKLYVYANDFLSDVFENIIINAIKHNINQQVEILIKISSYNQNDKDYYKFEFLDNGNGISDELKSNIFKSNDNKYEYGKGLGIGLSLVKLVVSRYEGKIWVEDRIKGDYSKGSNFIILLPKAKIAHPIPI